MSSIKNNKDKNATCTAMYARAGRSPGRHGIAVVSNLPSGLSVLCS